MKLIDTKTTRELTDDQLDLIAGGAGTLYPVQLTNPNPGVVNSGGEPGCGDGLAPGRPLLA
jgi:hypothetical protein